jgi:Ni,Fe-hydrogenase III small subunit/formate hydrogenlyase subunit 6/NADH:ubiquinone oxidoreductase subunit I
MFKIIQKTLKTGIATVPYPAATSVSTYFRGRPEFDFERWRCPKQIEEACPTGAVHVSESDNIREVTIDYGRCTYCGVCADQSTDGAVRMTNDFELAVTDRRDLMVKATYVDDRLVRTETFSSPGAEDAGLKLKDAIHRVLGRSLAIRQLDAGSCNGCEQEIVALNNPVHDIERFGIHFVASPRHADMLLVTGPITRNMELAARKTYAATPAPKVVAAVGACGISGGIFGRNYATVGAVDEVLPVDVYIPGCPPRPEALLHGILLAVGRLGDKRRP